MAESHGKGQILIEALIGMALLALGMGVGALLIFGGSRTLSDRAHASRARLFAEEGVSATRSVIERDWESVSPGEHGLALIAGEWQFAGTSDTNGMFTRVVVVSSSGLYEKEARIRVSWSVAADRKLFVEMPTLFSRWKEAVASGGGPGSGEGSPLSGDWTRPKTIGTGDVIPSGRKGADIVLRGTYAYLATTRTGSSDSFTVFDVANPASPARVGGYDTGDDLTSLAVASRYAYVSSVSNSKEFLILDVSLPSGIVETGSLNLSGAEDALTAYYDGRYAYVGRQAGAAIDEFVVLNVSNPSSPSVVGSFDVGASVRDIYVLEDTAYLATDVSGKELMLLDVSSPTPSYLGSFSAPLGDAGAGRSVFAQSKTRVFFGTSERVIVLNTASSSNIISYGSFSTGGSVNDLAAVGRYVFAVTSNSNSELFVLDVSSPASIVEISSFNYPQDGVGVDYENNRAYAAVRSNDVLRIVGPGD
ncbi:MAG: hypothetical protein Q8R20_01050 [Nanoarchaeota archaeon]|nr:hypothetical protein [Nanoarchaeota archaeon]